MINLLAFAGVTPIAACILLGAVVFLAFTIPLAAELIDLGRYEPVPQPAPGPWIPGTPAADDATWWLEVDDEHDQWIRTWEAAQR